MSSSSPILFKASTNTGHVIKSLAEILHHGKIRDGPLHITSDGIRLRMMNLQKSTLFDIFLKANNFITYKMEKKEIIIGVNLGHLFESVKNVKKADKISLFITKNETNKLKIEIKPKDESGRVKIVSIMTHHIQILDIDVPMGYSRPINVQSSEFKNTLRDLKPMGKVLDVSANKFQISFGCSRGGVFDCDVVLGEEPEEPEDKKIVYQATFDTERFMRIQKIPGVGNNVQIFTSQGLPLKIMIPVGGIGEMSIFIKSNENIHSELDKKNLC